jgi:hypothetical protein
MIKYNKITHTSPPVEDGTECSETSAFNIQTPGKYPEDNLSLQQYN